VSAADRNIGDGLRLLHLLAVALLCVWQANVQAVLLQMALDVVDSEAIDCHQLQDALGGSFVRTTQLVD
jgi:hypothetical protein